ncbi:MAG TPA: YhjD/YihY/BrkB family envelope integrity protein, partial [Pseudobdellovibrionaceae bacterium]|nr:YhjD/YihY/BrkB family envelope integrity protein [Pseudobdellovibrionaceae bacterium]
MNSFMDRISQLAKDIYNQMKEGEVQLVAGSLAFSTILGIVPFIALILSIVQYLNGFESFYPKIENLILGVFKDAAGAEAIRVMKLSIRNIHVGTIGTTGALFLIVTSLRLLADMEYGINRVWNIKLKRSLIKRFFFYQLILVFVPFFLVSAFTVFKIKSQWDFVDWLPKESLVFLFLFLFIYTVY